MRGGEQSSPSALISLLILVLLLAICLGAGGLGSMLTLPSLSPWYADLRKPSFNPPNSVFAPVWTTLFILMAFSAWRVWRAAFGSGQFQRHGQRAFFWFAVQLILNVSWSAAFFYLQNPLLGLAVITMLLVVLVKLFVVFIAIDRLAGWLFVPYIAWVGFAAVLNLSIFLLN